MATQMTRPFLDSNGNRTRVTQRGTFWCPTCKADRPFQLVEVRKSVKMGPLAVWSYGQPDEHVECMECRCTFIPEALKPAAREWGLKPNHLWAAQRVMVLMMLADGIIEEEEVKMISEVYQEIGGEPMPDTAVRSAAADANADPRELEEFLNDVAPRLNEQGKLLVIKSAYRVAAADGEFQQEERELMGKLIRAMDLRSGDPFQILGIEMPLA